jgi:hypothetical protein
MHTRFDEQKRWFGVLAIVAIWGMILLPVAAVRGEPSEIEVRMLAIGPKIISGHVYLVDGVTPVASAVIVATVWNGTSIEATLFATTDSSGFYSVTFAPSDWNIGNFIIVGASAGGDAGEGTAFADSSPTQTINMTLNLAVPEFGVPETLVAGMVVAMFALIGRRIVR